MSDVSGSTRDSKPRIRPWLAVLLSIVGPGWGHLYCGRPKLAFIWFFIVFIANTLCYYLLKSVNAAPLNLILFMVAALTIILSVTIHAYKTAKSIGEAYLPGWYSRWYTNVGAVAWIILFSYIYIPPASQVQFFSVPQTSMEDAVLSGDRVLCDKVAYCKSVPKVNDVVIFRIPGDDKTSYVKRCIALPGDTVEIREKSVLVNGKLRVEPPSIKHIDQQVNANRDNFGPFLVPPATIFVLGDNRDNSIDSRTLGPVPYERIIGRAIRIYWSSNLSRLGKPVV